MPSKNAKAKDSIYINRKDAHKEFQKAYLLTMAKAIAEFKTSSLFNEQVLEAMLLLYKRVEQDIEAGRETEKP